jgi:hypothetical protein
LQSKGSSAGAGGADGNPRAQFQYVYDLAMAIESGQYTQSQQLLTQAKQMLPKHPTSNLATTTTTTMIDVTRPIQEKILLVTLLRVITTTGSSTGTNASHRSSTTTSTAMDIVSTDAEMKEDTAPTAAVTTTTMVSDRTFTFDDLKVALHLPDTGIVVVDDNTTEKVSLLFDLEWILMRALSLGLIKGQIDEVQQSITITYVQPYTTLTTKQLIQLQNQYTHWTNTILTNITSLQREAITTTSSTN